MVGRAANPEQAYLSLSATDQELFRMKVLPATTRTFSGSCNVTVDDCSRHLPGAPDACTIPVASSPAEQGAESLDSSCISYGRPTIYQENLFGETLWTYGVDWTICY